MSSLLPSFLRRGARRQVYRRESAEAAPPQESLPGTVRADLSAVGARRYYEAFIGPILDGNRLFVLCVLLAGIALAEGVALSMLIPLKEKVPYLNEFDDDGHLQEVAKFKPATVASVTQKQTDFFLKTWVRWLLTIDSQMSLNLPKTSGWVRGAAVAELADWIDKVDRPGERRVKEPDLTREVTKMVATYGQGKTTFLHIELVERRLGVETRRHKKIIQFDYELLPEQLGEDNPIGLGIVHFTIAEE